MYISVAQKMPEIWQETRKNKFWQKLHFVKNYDFSLQNPRNHQIHRFTFLAISLTIFELQRRTIPHFNPLNKSIWPLGHNIFPRVHPFWAIRQNIVTGFFLVRFYHLKQSKNSSKLDISWFFPIQKSTFRCFWPLGLWRQPIQCPKRP